VKDTQGRRNCRYSIGHFLLVVCSNNDSILNRFRDITTCTVYDVVRYYLWPWEFLHFK